MLANLNYLHIAVAALVYFILGSLWYSVFFGKVWMQLLGISGPPTEEDRKGMPMMFGKTFVLNFIIVLSTAVVIYFVKPVTLLAAIKTGGLLGVGFVFTTCAMGYMYTKRPFKLTLIDSGYHIVAIIVAAIILTCWH
jgi:hypothetical protein